MKNPYIIPAAMICVAILAGFWMLKPSSEPQKVVVVQPPKTPDISMWKAARDGNIEAVRQHLASGTDVDAKTDNEWTPLHFAADYGRKEIVELLITKGADVNAKNDWGRTPLHYADNKEIAELLIAEGADVNAKADDGRTPLDVAIHLKRTETADLLRKHGGKTKKELAAASN